MKRLPEVMCAINSSLENAVGISRYYFTKDNK